MRVVNYMVTGQRRLGAGEPLCTILSCVDGVHVLRSAVPHYKPGTPMKTARFLLACVAASLLAACSADGITAPASPATPSRPAFDEDVGPGGDDEGGTYTSDTGLGGTANCILVAVLNVDGSITM